MPCMCLSLRNVVKPSKSMGAQEACIGIGNIYSLTLKSARGMGTPRGLKRREEVPSLCCVSGYYGVVLAYSQGSYPWSSWREPLVCIGEGAM